MNFLKIYFGKEPFLLFEIIFSISTFMAFVMYPQIVFLFAILVSIASGIAVFMKWKLAFLGFKILESGAAAQAKLIKIDNTNVKVNRRIVKKYTFRFYIESEYFDHVYKSNRNKKLTVGDEKIIYYQLDNPNKALVPDLYGIKL